MEELDKALRLEMAAAAARELTAQLARKLADAKWEVQLVVPVDAQVMSRRLHTPMLRARQGCGRVAAMARPDGDVVFIVKRVREDLREDPNGVPRVHEEESWHGILTSSTPIPVVLSVATLAAFQPDDLRLEGP